MESEFRKLLKGKWDFNIQGNDIMCRNKDGIIHIFHNKDNTFFQNIFTTLSRRGNQPDPHLIIKYDRPESSISLEQFHRVMYSNELMYEQTVTLAETRRGLLCYSEHTHDYPLNSEYFFRLKEVHVDPQKVCKITRKIKNRERVKTKLRLERERIILECEFPWTILTVIVPTVNIGD